MQIGNIDMSQFNYPYTTSEGQSVGLESPFAISSHGDYYPLNPYYGSYETPEGQSVGLVSPFAMSSLGVSYHSSYETPEGQSVGLASPINMGSYSHLLSGLQKSNKEAKKETNKESISNVIDEELECSICLEDIDYGTELICNHKFCYDCIEEFNKKPNQSCPMCRGQFEIKKHFITKEQKLKLIKQIVKIHEEKKKQEEEKRKWEEKKNEIKKKIKNNDNIILDFAPTFMNSRTMENDRRREEAEDEMNKEKRRLDRQKQMQKMDWRAKRGRR